VTDRGEQDRGKREEFREGEQSHGKGYPGPSTGAPPGAIEGSIMEEDERRTEGSDQATTGAGAEAVEGLHATRGRDPREKTSLADRPVGRDPSGGAERAGSEPVDREAEHKGSYGGEGGEPRTSSDQRE
jgi:hypothetical protein